MAYDKKQVGVRLRELREIYDFTLDEVAKKLNISPDDYAEIEQGNIDISISTLYDASILYNVELTAILTGDEPKLKVYSLVRKNEGLSVNRSVKYKHQSLAYNFTNKKAEPFLVTVEPEDDNIPMYLNTHPGQEMNYVIEGSVKIVVNNHELILNEGDTLYFDSSYPHGMKALNGKTAKFVAVIM